MRDMTVKGLIRYWMRYVLVLYLFFVLFFSSTTTCKCKKRTDRASVWYGHKPPNSESKPVLIFIHGYTKNSSCWVSDRNTMYMDAFLCGYRTAFIDTDPYGCIRSNGVSIARLIREVLEYYGVSTVVCICHSKGGLDLQGAVFYTDIGPCIHRVITLGTPYMGSPIADITCFLLKFMCLGFTRDCGLKDLRTGAMKRFQKIYDSDALCTRVPFYSFGGTGTDKRTKRKLWNKVTKTLMNWLGPNDDLVLVDDAMTRNGEHVANVPYCHEQLFSGEIMWNVIEPFLK